MAQADQEIIDRAIKMESAGLRYCFTCGSWDDDTDCYPEDHSRHCGHELKPLGFELDRAYRLICVRDVERLIAVTRTAATEGAA